MEDLGGIVWRASIDTQGMTTAERSVNRSVGNVERDFKRVDRSGNQLSATMSRVAKAVGSVLAVRQIQRFILGTAQAIDEQGKFASAINVSFEALQRLQFAAEQNGATTNEFNNSLRRLARRTEEAARGTGAAVQAFENLGLKAEELQNLSPDEIFLRVSDAFRDNVDASKEVSTAFGLFDTEGAKLINTLRLGSDGINELGEEAERTGRVIGQQTAEDAAKFNDELNKLRGAAKGAAVQLGGDLLPALTGVIETFTDFIADGDNVNKIVQTMTVVAQAAAVLFAGRFVASMVASVRAMQMATVASRTLAASMAFLGGPVGAVVIAAGALALIGNELRKATKDTDTHAESVETLTEKYRDFTAAQIERERVAAQQEQQEAKRQKERLQRELELARIARDQSGTGSGFGLGGFGAAQNEVTRLSKEIEYLESVIEQTENEIKALDEVVLGVGRSMDNTADSTRRASTATEESTKVITDLALANEQLRAELNGTADELEIQRALQAAGVEAGTAEANVIRGLIESNRAYTQAIRDRADAEREAAEEKARIESEFADVSQRAQQEPMSPAERLRAEMEERMAVIDEYAELELAKDEEVAAARLAVQESYHQRLRELENQRMSLILGSTAQIFGDLSGLAKTFAGEQSGIYKGLFAASKAFSIAQSIMAIQTGIAQAAAIPFPANLGAMATVAASAAGIVSTIKGTQMGSGRLYGGNTERGRMYPVTEDGRPELYTENGRQYLLPGARGEVTSNRDMGGGTVNQVSIEMPVAIHGDATASNLEMFRDALFDLEPDLIAAVERGLNREGRRLS